LSTSIRIVLDTNVLLSGLVSPASASRTIVDALDRRRAVPLLSAPVLAEYRATLLHPSIQTRFTELTPWRVALALERLRYIGDEYRRVKTHFEFPRDPRDAMFIELSLTGNATHLISLDPDLLTLPTSRTGAGKRFRQRLPHLQILRPDDFVRLQGDLL